MEIIPTEDNVLIQLDPIQTTTASGLFLGHAAANMPSNKGVCIAGEYEGERVALKPGYEVLFAVTNDDKEDFVVVAADSIVAFIRSE